jgi:hypothetical protein
VALESLTVQPSDAPALAALYRRFGFKSLLADLESPAGPGEMDLFGGS